MAAGAAALATKRVSAPRLALSLIGIGLFAIFLLQKQIERRLPQAVADETNSLPSAATVRRFSLGYTGLAADIYWTRAIQYFGSRHGNSNADYPLLVPLLNLTYELDPDLTAPAEYGSFFLADMKPLGAGEPHAAVALLERAIARHPTQWRLYFDLGFIYALNLHDRRHAAQAFYRGSLQPGSHPVLKTLAAAYMTAPDERMLARTLWTDLAEHSPDKLVRENARDHLQSLRVREDFEHLQALANQFQRRSGHAPSNWRELIMFAGLPSIPVDPQGRAYRLLPGGRFAVDPATKIRSMTEKLPG